MKIGIDTFSCGGGKSAVGTYLMNLLKRVPPSGALVELFGWEFDRFAYSEAAPNFEFISECSVNGRLANLAWHITTYPAFAKKRGYDACFFPAAHKRLPSKSPCPSIGTVHDTAAFWGIREKKDPLGEAIRFVFPSLLRKMDKIIAVSEFIKNDLVEIARVKQDRIEVVANGIDTNVFYPRPKNEDSVVLIQPFSFRQPYILYTSRIEYPIKNHVKLIEAFGIFKERTHYPHKLILAGEDSRGAERVREAASLSAFKRDIFFTGHFPAKSLPELYAGADMVVIPSLYEGFGMSALEAMASGVPVACARAASLPEAADHAALYFDPEDAEDMADRLFMLATNGEMYRECRAHGLERVKSFTWDRCVKRTLDIIHEMSGR
jgi:glycosyltransferase involved in cell wall biosynthesis